MIVYVSTKGLNPPTPFNSHHHSKRNPKLAGRLTSDNNRAIQLGPWQWGRGHGSDSSGAWRARMAKRGRRWISFGQATGAGLVQDSVDHHQMLLPLILGSAFPWTVLAAGLLPAEPKDQDASTWPAYILNAPHILRRKQMFHAFKMLFKKKQIFPLYSVW